MTEFVTVGKTDDLQPGECKVVEANGKKFALFNVNGTFHALANTCCHKGGPLGEGTLEGDIVTCPWHQWQFKVNTGENVQDSETKIDSFKVKVEDNEVKVEIE